MVVKFNKNQMNFLKKQLPVNDPINSVYLSKKSSKAISEYFSKTGFFVDSWPYLEAELDLLEQNEIIYHNKRDSKYQLTYKGLIVIEYGIYSLNPEINKLLDDINKFYFKNNLKTQNKPFNPKERALLFTILGIQAFSEDSSMEFNDTNKIDFKEASHYSIDFLKKIFPEEENDYDSLWKSNAKGLDPVVAILNTKLEELPFKTEGLFIRPSNFNIYLDLLDLNGNIKSSNYIFLIKKLLKEKYLSETDKEELIQALNKIEKKSILLIKTNQNVDKLKIDNQVKDIIKYDY